MHKTSGHRNFFSKANLIRVGFFLLLFREDFPCIERCVRLAMCEQNWLIDCTLLLRYSLYVRNIYMDIDIENTIAAQKCGQPT